MNVIMSSSNFQHTCKWEADVESCLDTDVGFGAEPVADIDMRIAADLQLSTAIIYLL